MQQIKFSPASWRLQRQGRPEIGGLRLVQVPARRLVRPQPVGQERQHLLLQGLHEGVKSSGKGFKPKKLFVSIPSWVAIVAQW